MIKYISIPLLFLLIACSPDTKVGSYVEDVTGLSQQQRCATYQVMLDRFKEHRSRGDGLTREQELLYEDFSLAFLRYLNLAGCIDPDDVFVN